MDQKTNSRIKLSLKQSISPFSENTENFVELLLVFQYAAIVYFVPNLDSEPFMKPKWTKSFFN